MARHPVTNQMSIGSEKVPISGERARNGKFGSAPPSEGSGANLTPLLVCTSNLYRRSHVG
jgi:hypothetical protein